MRYAIQQRQLHAASGHAAAEYSRVFGAFVV
jgi:hypothetical protein